MFEPRRLGQIPLVLGPSSWGAGMVPISTGPTPPFYGQWGVVSGQVGPFATSSEAFSAAARAAIDSGATELPTDGFAQVVDSKGRPAGPVT